MRGEMLRILALRTFRSSESDFRDILMFALAARDVGQIILIGSHGENEKLRSAIEMHPPIATIVADFIEFVDSEDDSWRRIVIGEILRADALIIRFTSKAGAFERMSAPEGAVSDFVQYYKIPLVDPRTGRGLLA